MRYLKEKLNGFDCIVIAATISLCLCLFFYYVTSTYPDVRKYFVVSSNNPLGILTYSYIHFSDWHLLTNIASVASCFMLFVAVCGSLPINVRKVFSRFLMRMIFWGGISLGFVFFLLKSVSSPFFAAGGFSLVAYAIVGCIFVITLLTMPIHVQNFKYQRKNNKYLHSEFTAVVSLSVSIVSLLLLFYSILDVSAFLNVSFNISFEGHMVGLLSGFSISLLFIGKCLLGGELFKSNDIVFEYTLPRKTSSTKIIFKNYKPAVDEAKKLLLLEFC